jgi:glycerol-3-phosphate O-acyltransferase / dihydroxyacetone phosphate acyltransferase
MRPFLVSLFRLALRIFFRRIEVVGLHNIRADRAVMFAVNHPNGLVDPLFVLCFAPRRVSFLAKAPLFRYPLIGWIVRKFDSIPVFRKQDEVQGSNEETFARARAILAQGGSVAIFPEGTTHSDPQLHPLKTGVARIALGAITGEGAGAPPLDIVPTGIYYTEKQTFRSSALVVFGTPIDVRGDESVESLTARVDDGLDAVTLQADSRAALELIARAEEIFNAEGESSLAEEFEIRRRFVDGYHYLREHDPLRLAILEAGIMSFVEDRRSRLSGQAGVPVLHFALLPIAIAGAIINYPTYRLIGALTNRLSRENEMRATMKFVGALTLFPVTWVVLAMITKSWCMLIAAPLLGYVAVRVFESIAQWRKRPGEDFAAKRAAVRDEILAVAKEMEQMSPRA